MSDAVLTSIITGLVTIIVAAIGLYGTIQVARITATKESQVGAVGEEKAKNQVSPLPPVGD
jgi:hypothetical protein